ncbi:MAG TPA: hypothetical protein VFS21_14915 [Roseiflexaceae bacterium]|nr:hypothetical protein [Roseiflexaceae bacterium]
MAVVSRPTRTISRRTVWSHRVRNALASVWMTALAYALLLILGYLLLTPVFAWGQRRIDDLRYGYPRSTQVSGFVGHDEHSGLPTQLIALNLRGQVSIVELPGSDAQKVRSLPGPYLVGADGPYVAPQLSLADMNADGSLDLLLQVREEVVVYVNDQGAFRLITPAERVRLTQPAAPGP